MNFLLSSDLNYSVQSLVRSLYGCMLFGFLTLLFINRKLYFRTEKWNGYIFSSKVENFWNRPVLSEFILGAWFLSAFCLIIGYQSFWALLLNLIFCRYYFIHLRWKSLSRGCGAPGFITQWLAYALFLLELTAQPGILPELRRMGIFLVRADFAWIILSAGFYKLFGGYFRNEGMEYGMVNPMWGYYWKKFFKMQPKSVTYWILNQLGWFTEILAACLMILPFTAGWGGLLLSVTFLFIATQIRLGFLCYMVALIGCLYAEPSSLFSKITEKIYSFIGYTPSIDFSSVLIPEFLQKFVLFVLTIHLFLLPVAYLGIWYNHATGRKILSPFQKILQVYTNLFGIIIWRVFAKDLTNLLVTIFARSKNGEEKILSEYGSRFEWTGYRYSQVTESIAVDCLFTTLRYYPDNRDFFHKKLKQYALSLHEKKDSTIIFKVTKIKKSKNNFFHDPSAVYEVCLEDGSISEKITSPIWNKSEDHFLLKPSIRPGSYA